MDEGLQILTDRLFAKDWFCQASFDNIGRYVVYVRSMNMETMTTIPDTVLGKQVLVHYFSSKPEEVVSIPPPPPSLEELDQDLLEDDVDELIAEMNVLRAVCGSNTLESIFFEVHDKNNAITNYSPKYPTVRSAMERVYNEYGFDVIYDQFER